MVTAAQPLFIEQVRIGACPGKVQFSNSSHYLESLKRRFGNPPIQIKPITL
jgi:hypothetical protein